jgi:predicted permease
MGWLHDLAALTGALTPVFALVVLGLLLRRIRLFSEAGVEDLNRLVYWIALPAQLFLVISRCSVLRDVPLGGLVATIASFVIGMAAAWWATAGLAPAARGSIVSGVARPNAAFIGLPVVQLVAGTMPAAAAQSMLAAYGVLLGVMVACFNIGAVAAFLLPRQGLTRAGFWLTVSALPRNPLIIGSLAGVAASLVHPGLCDGTMADSALSLVASLAIPLALLLTGLQLDVGQLRRHPRVLILATIGKLIAVPALTWAVGALLGLEHGVLVAAVVMMACPVAMASTAMARLLGGDVELMAASIVATTVCSPVTLIAWLLVLR